MYNIKKERRDIEEKFCMVVHKQHKKYLLMKGKTQ